MLVICSFGIMIALIEPKTFPSIFTGIWWAIITASTVGYGDYVPKTTPGKIVGMILILVGVGFVSTYFITLAKTAVSKQNDYIEGKTAYKGRNHYILVGWNERTREILGSLFYENNHQTVILIDFTLENNPMPHHPVHFIKGRSNLDEVLIKANVFEAAKVLITADQNKDEMQADMQSILTLLAIKGLNPNVKCIVEILTSEQMANAKRAGADEIIQSNIISSFVMINSMTTDGMVNSLLHLLDHLNGNKVSFSSSKKVVGKNFVDASTYLLQQGNLLIGIKRGEYTTVNPPGSFIIEENDRLLTIETYTTL